MSIMINVDDIVEGCDEDEDDEGWWKSVCEDVYRMLIKLMMTGEVGLIVQ